MHCGCDFELDLTKHCCRKAVQDGPFRSQQHCFLRLHFLSVGVCGNLFLWGGKEGTEAGTCLLGPFSNQVHSLQQRDCRTSRDTGEHCLPHLRHLSQLNWSFWQTGRVPESLVERSILAHCLVLAQPDCLDSSCHSQTRGKLKSIVLK